MNERQSASILAALAKAKRENLRRMVLVSTADDYTIATQVDCNPMHVKAMRDRLVALGVLQRPTLTPPRNPRRSNGKPPKWRNADLFEDE